MADPTPSGPSRQFGSHPKPTLPRFAGEEILFPYEGLVNVRLRRLSDVSNHRLVQNGAARAISAAASVCAVDAP